MEPIYRDDPACVNEPSGCTCDTAASEDEVCQYCLVSDLFKEEGFWWGPDSGSGFDNGEI
jgi:hypothetical protein